MAERLTRPGHPYLAGAPLLIAHRGGAKLAPENTIRAFERAISWWRADLLELDVRTSRDGHVVVIHDELVDRTTNATGPVRDLTLAELRSLDAGYHFSSDGGATFPFRGQGVTIPTLSEVLGAFPTTRINVEIKAGEAQLPTRTAIREAGAEHRVLIAAGNHAHRSEFSDYPGPTSAAESELRRFYIFHRLNLLRFYTPRVAALQLPETHGGKRIVSPDFIARAHTKNLAVHVWTVDETDDMHRLLDWGVDGIVTDRPDRLARVIHERTGRPAPPGP